MSREQAAEPKFGNMEMSGKEISIPGVRFDKLALSGRNELLLMSIVAESQRVKQIRAILAPTSKGTAQKTVTIQASGIKVRRPGEDEWRASTPGRIYAGGDGYQVITHKLGYGLIHALFLTRTPGFMPVVSHASLWNELKDSRFTTPVIPEWLPFIEERLRDADLLEDAHAFNCRCGLLSALTKNLDEIVSEGLQQRLISIPSAVVAELAEAAA